MLKIIENKQVITLKLSKEEVLELLISALEDHEQVVQTPKGEVATYIYLKSPKMVIHHNKDTEECISLISEYLLDEKQ